MKILKYNNFMNEGKIHTPDLINHILDKVGNVGFKNLATIEKEILTKYSEGGENAIKQYLDDENKGEITFAKGQILVDGLPYEEWQRQQKKGSNDPHQYQKVKKGSSSFGSFKVRLYRKYGSGQRYYYIFHEDGKKQVYRSVSDKPDENPFGEGLLRVKGYENKSLNDTHAKLIDKHQFDEYRDLTADELGDFETLLSMRSRYRKGEFTKKTKSNEESMKQISLLYKQFKSA